MSENEFSNIPSLGEPGQYEIIWRTGAAEAPVKWQPINISGNIKAPAEYAQKRLDDRFEANDAFVVVDASSRSITLHVHADIADYSEKVTGTINLNQYFEQFNIGQERAWTTSALADFCRRNIRFFRSKEEAAKLIAGLKHFTGTVQGKVESLKDRSAGAFKEVAEKYIQHELPQKVVLSLPLFEGYPPNEFEVEIFVDIRENAVSITLDSIEVEQLADDTVRLLLEENVSWFRENDIAVIYKR